MDHRKHMGPELDKLAWAEIPNDVLPVELGKLLAGQHASGADCMAVIKAQADDLAAPFRAG